MIDAVRKRRLIRSAESPFLDDVYLHDAAILDDDMHGAEAEPFHRSYYLVHGWRLQGNYVLCGRSVCVRHGTDLR